MDDVDEDDGEEATGEAMRVIVDDELQAGGAAGADKKASPGPGVAPGQPLPAGWKPHKTRLDLLPADQLQAHCRQLATTVKANEDQGSRLHEGQEGVVRGEAGQGRAWGGAAEQGARGVEEGALGAAELDDARDALHMAGMSKPGGADLLVNLARCINRRRLKTQSVLFKYMDDVATNLLKDCSTLFRWSDSVKFLTAVVDRFKRTDQRQRNASSCWPHSA